MSTRPRVSIVCSDPRHPVMAPLSAWIARHGELADFTVVHEARALSEGDMLFLISCHERVTAEQRSRFDAAMVLHASDLPKGRGWSPLVWQVLEGAREITVTLLDAADRIDAGDVRLKKRFSVEPHETLDEINRKLFECEFALMAEAIRARGALPSVPQEHDKATYYRRRTPEDSRLDPERSIAEQFDKLRLADQTRYPCFFELHGHRYELRLEKRDPQREGDEQ